MSNFTKDDFIEPSVYSVYTIIPAHGYNQDEVDDRASCLSEQMKKINQRYETFLQEEQTQCLKTAETESVMHQQMHLLNAINEAAWGQGMDNLYDEADSVSVISAQSVWNYFWVGWEAGGEEHQVLENLLCTYLSVPNKASLPNVESNKKQVHLTVSFLF